ncbi:MAG: lysoplasmalogenase family protein [Candidatus Cryptobacteroides sp.]|nr:lysoplasmalogenase [Bacteroidales bacterium]
MNSDKTAIELVKSNKQLATTVIIFTVLVIAYFFPSNDMKSFLPDFIAEYRIAWPLLTLTIAGAFLVAWPVAVAMLFSFAGDFMGAYGSFIGQMICFAIAHGMFIYYFSTRFKSESKVNASNMKIVSRETADKFNELRLKRIVTFCVSASVTLIFISVAISFILPDVPAGVLRIGCGVYSGLISIMVGTALLQRDFVFTLGALLFLFSDMILAWNKFVAPVEYSGALIMIPYYSGQLLIWLRASVDNARRNGAIVNQSPEKAGQA